MFVGKLIVSKGVDLLMAAWPLVRAAHPEARLQVAGYGEYEDGLRRLLAALDRGDLDDAREVARLGWALEGGEEKPLTILSAFLADPPPGYLEAAQRRGRLDRADRPPRARPGRRAAAPGRGAGDAEHLPGGLRDGRGRGRGLRDAAGLGWALGDARGVAAAGRGAAARRSAGSPRSRSSPAPSRRSPTGSTAGWRCRRPSARTLARRWWRPWDGCGAGREWPAGCSPPRPASSAICPVRLAGSSLVPSVT